MGVCQQVPKKTTETAFPDFQAKGTTVKNYTRILPNPSNMAILNSPYVKELVEQKLVATGYSAIRSTRNIYKKPRVLKCQMGLEIPEHEKNVKKPRVHYPWTIHGLSMDFPNS